MEFLADLVDNDYTLSDRVDRLIGFSRSGHLPGAVSGAENEIRLR